jgi:protein arginine kinase activator
MALTAGKQGRNGDVAMKCQRCPKAAALHITEIHSEDHFEELHLCEECCQKYLYQPQSTKSTAIKAAGSGSEDGDEPAAMQHECGVCGIKFVDFRNSGRLGCPHDYAEFKDELLPLLENIHGETKHVGKTPRRRPDNRKKEAELMTLRKQLASAVNKEDYEEAARLRDLIRQVEG